MPLPPACSEPHSWWVATAHPPHRVAHPAARKSRAGRCSSSRTGRNPPDSPRCPSDYATGCSLASGGMRSMQRWRRVARRKAVDSSPCAPEPWSSRPPVGTWPGTGPSRRAGRGARGAGRPPRTAVSRPHPRRPTGDPAAGRRTLCAATRAGSWSGTGPDVSSPRRAARSTTADQRRIWAPPSVGRPMDGPGRSRSDIGRRSGRPMTGSRPTVRHGDSEVEGSERVVLHSGGGPPVDASLDPPGEPAPMTNL